MLKSLGFEPLLNARDKLERVVVRTYIPPCSSVYSPHALLTGGESGEMYPVQHERAESDGAFQARVWDSASK